MEDVKVGKEEGEGLAVSYSNCLYHCGFELVDVGEADSCLGNKIYASHLYW